MFIFIYMHKKQLHYVTSCNVYIYLTYYTITEAIHNACNYNEFKLVLTRLSSD